MPFVNRLFGKDKEQEQLKDQAESAGIHFDSGQNCAQSVLLSAADALDFDLPEILIRGMASFTGGIGNSGCICGALTAAAMVAGIVSIEDDRRAGDKKANKAASKILMRFKDDFGSTCCRVLRKGMHGADAHKRCRELTIGATSIMLDVLSDRHLGIDPSDDEKNK